MAADHRGTGGSGPRPGGRLLLGLLTALVGLVGARAVGYLVARADPSPVATARPGAVAGSWTDLSWPAALAALLAAAVLVLLGAALRGRPPTLAAGRAPGPDASAGTDLPAAVAERRTLVRTCIEVADLLPEGALRFQLREGLRRAGVVELDATGQLFDPTRHRAVDQVPTTDRALQNRVAATERAGFADHGSVLRPPEVSVYRLGPATADDR